MANEQDQNKQEKDWAQIIDKSRKDNANIMSLFPTAPHQQATFTERFRVQTAASGEELVTMQNQLQEVCDEWLAARAEALAAQPVVTTPVIIRAAQTRTHRHGRLRRRTFAVTPRYYAKAAAHAYADGAQRFSRTADQYASAFGRHRRFDGSH